MKTTRLLRLPRLEREKPVDVCTFINNELALRPVKNIPVPDWECSGVQKRQRADAYDELVSTPAKVDPRCLVRPLTPPGRRVSP